MALYLDLDYLKSTGKKPNFFGLGFIQLKLNEVERLHFYHPSLSATVDESEYHDHRYEFNSKILSGSFTQEISMFKSNGSVAKSTHYMSPVSCQAGVYVSDVIMYGNMQFLYSATYAAGSEYTISPTVFHRVKADNCITLLTRKSPDKEFAHVVREIENVNKVCPFETHYTEDDCWKMIAEMLPKKAGYHIDKIEKGELGEVSKIVEEVNELNDAETQGVKIMQQVELSDLYGAMKHYIERHHSSITMKDLEDMHKVTNRAFVNGHR